jgi:predicted transcriptional regulator
LISFIDGKRYKTLKRHLTTHGLTVAEYKARYGLPADYPTTAPSYSEHRSAMARTMGLGSKGRAAKGRG